MGYLLKISTLLAATLAVVNTSAVDRPEPFIGQTVGATIGAETSPDGKEVARCDLADKFHMQNKVGINFAGLCVFASMRHAGYWQDEPLFQKMLDFMTSQLGGGYPTKVDDMLIKASAKFGLPIPPYVQMEDGDLEILKLACKCGYMPGITYGISPTGRYNGREIAHMVNLIHASDNWFCILDNNHIGGNQYEWMTPAEFKRTYTTNRGGWCIILMTTPTPPRIKQ